MGRKKARDNAFKCIYQFDFIEKGNIDSINNILKFCYEENENADDEKEYIENTVKGVNNNIQKIDEIILSKLKDWSIGRIAKIDLAILRLATYELLYTDIPPKVVINEAVELSKEYGDDNSSSFVNGVLAKIIEDKSKG